MENKNIENELLNEVEVEETFNQTEIKESKGSMILIGAGIVVGLTVLLPKLFRKKIEKKMIKNLEKKGYTIFKSEELFEDEEKETK